MRRVLVSTSGEVWLEREAREDGRVPWEVRDREGRLTGFLWVPLDVQILAVDGDIVWTERRRVGVRLIAPGRLIRH